MNISKRISKDSFCLYPKMFFDKNTNFQLSYQFYCLNNSLYYSIQNLKSSLRNFKKILISYYRLKLLHIIHIYFFKTRLQRKQNNDFLKNSVKRLHTKIKDKTIVYNSILFDNRSRNQNIFLLRCLLFILWLNFICYCNRI